MQYLLLIYGDEGSWDSLSEEERGQIFQAYGSFTKELEDSGAIAPVDPDAATQTFSADYLVLARTACRLRNDFELDTRGLAVALTLLDRVRALETELRELRAQLPSLIR